MSCRKADPFDLEVFMRKMNLFPLILSDMLLSVGCARAGHRPAMPLNRTIG